MMRATRAFSLALASAMARLRCAGVIFLAARFLAAAFFAATCFAADFFSATFLSAAFFAAACLDFAGLFFATDALPGGCFAGAALPTSAVTANATASAAIPARRPILKRNARRTRTIAPPRGLNERPPPSGRPATRHARKANHVGYRQASCNDRQREGRACNCRRR